MTCLYGVHIVGRVQLVFGIFSVISSIGMGPILRKFGKMPIFITAAVTNIGVIILMMLWNHYQMKNIIGDFFHVQHSHFCFLFSCIHHCFSLGCHRCSLANSSQCSLWGSFQSQKRLCNHKCLFVRPFVCLQNPSTS